jgi:hypothetical protein
MTLTEFFRRFTVHVTLALGVWLVAALALERIVPGFVTPFVNVPGVILVFVVLSAISLASFRGDISLARKVASTGVLAALFVAMLLFLWTRLDGLGGMTLLLLGAGSIATILLLIVLWSTDATA